MSTKALATGMFIAGLALSHVAAARGTAGSAGGGAGTTSSAGGTGGAPAAAAPEGTALPDCRRNALAEAMRDLFPPAPEEVRAGSATLLGLCRAPGGEGVLAAAARQTLDPATLLAITHALTNFGRSPVAVSALLEMAAPSRPAVVRAVAVPQLVRGNTDDLVAVLGNVRNSDDVRTLALDALTAAGRPPNRVYLQWLKQHSGPWLADRASRMLATTAVPARPARIAAPRTAGRSPELAAPDGAGGTPVSRALAADGVKRSILPAASSNSAAGTPAHLPEPTRRTGPVDGTPLAIGASTVAGGALMLNLSLLGFQDTTPQLLLGSAGAVIGFGTAWALSRFGVRPTMEQAAWFANVTGWGTLAGLTMYEGSGADNYKLRYFSLIAGEATGMAAGVWTARRWRWTTTQMAMSDSLFLGTALAAFGLDRLGNDNPRVTPAMAIGVVPAMVAAAIVGRALDPSEDDAALMASTAVAGGWLGGLVASGAAGTGLLDSRQGQGGLMLGAGLGYLGGAAAGAFTEVAPRRLRLGGAGLLAGNALGLGVNMMFPGLRRSDAGAFAAGDTNSWKLGTGIGGLAMGSVAFALAPRLRFGERALAMTTWGAAYGAGTYWLAASASYHGQARNDTTTAVLEGGMLATGVTGGLAGLLLSRRFAPDAADQWTAFGASAAGAATGWGTAALLSGTRGAADAIGVAAGAAGGLSVGAMFTHLHAEKLRPPALFGGFAGAGVGALFGALVPSLNEPTWTGDRTTSGAKMLGLGAGAFASTSIVELTGASAGQVAVPVVAGSLGLGAGTGAGLLFADTDSRPTRIGAAVGTAAFLGGSLLADRWLGLSEGLGPTAPGLAFVGAGFGGMEGVLLAGALDGGGNVTGARRSAVGGGLLLGASAGIAGGLALSRRLAPSGGELTLAAGNSLLWASAGYGVGELVTGADARTTTTATMTGAAAGLVTGGILAPRAHLTAPVVGGGLLGAAAGELVGGLAPSLGADQWTQSPRTEGGLRLGLAVGLLGGGAAAQASGATGRETAAVGIGASLGLGMGFGAGGLWSGTTTQPERIGSVVGLASMGAASAFLLRPLRLAEPFPTGSQPMVWIATAHGLFDGLWLAALVDPSGQPTATDSRRMTGGVILGGSVGITAGLLLARPLHLDESDLFVVSAGTLAGAGIGRGARLVATGDSGPGRGDAAATLAGSLAGTAAGALAAAKWGKDAGPVDAAAAVVGGGYGGLLGALIPSLGDSTWLGWQRRTTGGAFLGAGAGVAAGWATSIAVDADATDVTATTLAGADGAFTGLGWALLLSDDGAASGAVSGRAPSGSNHLRLGATLGTVGGLGLGMASWSHLDLGPGDRPMIAAAVTLAGWNGAWVTALGHASSSDFDGRQMAGGSLAAAGTASFGAALLAPAVQVDTDVVGDAVMLDAVFTGAGAGVGGLANGRADAPVAGMLAGGAAGLVLGGALHAHLEIGAAQVPLLTFGAGEGLWTGAWLPYLLRPSPDVSDSQRAGGVAAGAFGGLGLAMLASTRYAPTGGEVGFTALGSGIGAAITGGVALMSDKVRDQQSVGLTLAGTGLGLAAGGYLAPRLHIDLQAAGAASVGGVLGASEALVFAWSSRATGNDQYLGAGLLGAGVGTALGLATNANTELGGTGIPAVAGFTAWGAWMGAFAGSLLARDAHEITAGGLVGSNLGLLAGYGLLRVGAVDPGDFGWLSLFGAVGTVAGAAGGAPFASRGEPAPILGGLAIGPAVGMAIGALVLPRLRAARDASRATVARGGSAGGSSWAPVLLARADDGSSGASAVPAVGRKPDRATRKAAAGAPSSVEITRQAEEDHAQQRSFARALNASFSVSDCAPLIGALPTADAAPSGASPPMLVGVTGRWQ